MKKESWIGTLLSFAGACRGKMIASVFFAVLSVAGGFIPYLGVYQILCRFIERTMTMKQVLFWCGICVAGYVIKLVCYGISTMLSHISAYTILEQIRLKIADRLMRAPLGDVMGNSIGHLKNIIMDKVEAVEPPLAHMLPELSSNLLLPVAIFIYLFTFDWRMALATMATIPLAAVPMYFAMHNYNRQYASYMKANDDVNSVIVEYVEGIEVVKAFSQSDRSYRKFADAVNSFKAFTLDWFGSTWKSLNLVTSILPSTLVGVLPVGLALFQTGALTVQKLAMCVILSLSIVAPLMRLTAFINEMKSMEYAVKGANELLNMPSLPETDQKAELRGTEIQMNHVAFSYSGNTEDDVLHGIDLRMPVGSFTALVGPSGGGKSTVARLIARFWDVGGGSITIGGVNLKEIPISQLSGLISFVTQDNFLFNCSLKENIRLGKPTATDQEVLAAAKAAQCEEFIGRLEKGWDTPAGDAGKQLSGGEKQRIAIARAILKNAPIVILDEATAFTDPENEEKLQLSIARLTRGKTLLVIAHRLSTIQTADQIVVLERGTIVGKGTQAELLKGCPLYRQLWQAHVGAKHWSLSGKKKQEGAQAYV